MNEWEKIFKMEKSKKAYEEDVGVVYFGAASVKPEGASIDFDQMQESYTSRYTHVTRGIGFTITKEAIEDNLYRDVGKKGAMGLERSMAYSKEITGADVLNNAFDGNFVGGDGVSLLNTAHPLVGGGTWSNRLPQDADLSETSLEDILIQIEGFTDERGIPSQTNAMRLIIPRQLQFTACRILKSQYRTGTGDNDINAIVDQMLVPKGFTINHFLTDPDAWFLTTDAPEGLKMFQRRGVEKTMDGDFTTDNMRYKCTERYSFGWSDSQGLAGSAGA